MAAKCLIKPRANILQGVLCGLVLIVACGTQPVAAVSYGEGPYGACGYKGCESKLSPPTTKVTTATGNLEIAVNITDNQTLPANGYVVVVRLLSDPAVGFQRVDFYVDGRLMASVSPAAEDPLTVRWLWHTGDSPGTLLRVVATSVSGTTLERQFNVQITDQPTEAGVQTKDGLPGTLIEFIISLPRPLIYLLPYLLFLLLAMIGVILLLQTRREMAEYRILRRLSERSKATSEVKATFIQLVSHYLRTPITLINGGIDMLSEVDAPILRTLSQRMRLKVEALVAEAEQLHDEPLNVQPPAKVRIWSPALMLPIAAIGIFVAVFDYFVLQAGLLTGAEITLVIQALIFLLIASLLYFTFRSYQLKRRDARYIQSVLQQQSQVAQARDQVIADALLELSTDQNQMENLVARLPTTEVAGIIRDGLGRFHTMLARFAVAGRLKGGQSNAPQVEVGLHDLFEVVRQQVAAKAAAQNINLQLAAGATIAVRDPNLVRYVLTSVVDNAIAYSPPNSTVTISAYAKKGQTVITVADKGKGMTLQQATLLFQPFFKAEGTGVFNHEGMGFSLYLDKLIMTYLGGDIAVNSIQGKGSTFSLFFEPATT